VSTGEEIGPASSTRRIHIVVVAFHGAEDLARCLAPVTPVFPVTVVDNSSDACVRVVVREAGARYVDPGTNLGFGAAVNLALRELLAGPPADVLLLNPDAVVTAEAVQDLAGRFTPPGASRVGMLSPALWGPDGKEQRVVWPFPSPWRAWLEACGLGRLNRAAGFAVGAVLLLRWEALGEVGLFDERFFLYAEETDWQRRAAERGWRVAVAQDITATHVGGGTSTNSRRREALFHAGGETYIRKWFGRWGWALYRSAVLTGSLPRLLLIPQKRRGDIAYRMNLYWQGPRRIAGLEAE
jgi:GT2 family glycosyltransferase